MREARHQQARIEERLRDLKDRIRALEEQLPSAEAVQKATVEADALVPEVQSGIARFNDARASSVAAVEQVEAAVRLLTAAGPETGSVMVRLKELVRQYGLNTPIPHEPSLPPQEQRITWLVGQVLSQAADGDPDFGSLNVARAEQSPVRSKRWRRGESRAD